METTLDQYEQRNNTTDDIKVTRHNAAGRQKERNKMELNKARRGTDRILPSTWREVEEGKEEMMTIDSFYTNITVCFYLPCLLLL